SSRPVRPRMSRLSRRRIRGATCAWYCPRRVERPDKHRRESNWESNWGQTRFSSFLRRAAPALACSMVSLLDIIGPVMVGPSSSHTAGACRLGLLARGLVGGTPERARIELHGSFARTGEGHGTDKAIVAGLMGFRPDDDRIRQALEIAEREGLEYRFEKTTLDEEAHPNSVRITLE